MVAAKSNLSESPTVAEYIPGRPYTTGDVARLFRVTSQTIRDWIKAGRIKPMAVTSRLIDGGEVRRCYGGDLLVEDAKSGPLPETEGQLKRRAAKSLKKLAALG